MTPQSRAYWVAARGRGELRSRALPAQPPEGTVRVRALASGISAGTERLVGRGAVPERLHARMRCPGMDGSFALPVKYGYCLVGEALSGELAGARVFCLHPHEELADALRASCVVLPDAIPARRATLYANLETAVNGVWDAQLHGGERVLVLGLGAVGLLLSATLRADGVRELTLCDADPARLRALRAGVPWLQGSTLCTPDELADAGFDVVLHASGHPAGLARALRCLALEGRVIELSWFGAQDVTLPLGEDFHDRRLTIRSSQVAHVAPGRSHEERRAAVLAMLEERGAELDALLGEDVPFDELPATMAAIYEGATPFPAPVVCYSPRSASPPSTQIS